MAKLQFVFTLEGFYPDLQGVVPYSLEEKVAKDFVEDKYKALYKLGLEGKSKNSSASEDFLFLVAETFFKMLTDLPELEIAREKIEIQPREEIYQKLEEAIPFVIGAEYISREWINNIFQKLLEIFSREIKEYDGSVEMYFTEQNQYLRVPERIFFHLVETKDEFYPFAFLATYATKNKEGKVSHVPLQYALEEYKKDRKKLIALLSCLNRVAVVSDLIAGFIERGEMFHPLKLTSEEAFTFLKDIEEIEKAGILCRIPNWWKKKATAVSMSLSLGDKKPAMLGFDTIISMQPQLVVDGMVLTRADIKKLLAQTEGLALLKGKWVEVNHAKLKAYLAGLDEGVGETTLLEALKMQMSAEKQEADQGPVIKNGKWLSELLLTLRKPEIIKKEILPKTFQGKLRPYQKNGYAWLNYMGKLGFGACLADDMGLGKTIQVLSYLEKLRLANKKARVLLVVPASLLGNWQRETEKFTPLMPYQILHGKAASEIGKQVKEESTFLTITTYGMAIRIKELQEIKWDCLILDEAQAIKNPLTKQTKEIKKLNSSMRIAMTGTPIENDLTNLWSLFDFLDKGLLGTSKEFKSFCKDLSAYPEKYAKLKTMVAPFLLRRVKTDKTIIDDLPDKLESVDYSNLAKKQIVLYRKVVMDMEEKLNRTEGIQRKGIVLASILKLKQICNHPDQYLGQQSYALEDSGKFTMLKEICETIYEKRERVLVFTQFREITEFLADFLEQIFKAKGYVLHGGTPVKKRGEIVEAFQGEQYVPFIVLSVKAGGTGLNLTKANHVIHFDRWWNPAVENQATDRAFRIGQMKNVVVHKLVCKGTIEEKIDAMIESKKELAENVIGTSGEKWLTELGNEELMSMLRLDIEREG